MRALFTLGGQHLQRLVQEIALGYAWIMLVPSWRAGLLFGALTFMHPSAGALGLAGAISAWYAAHLAGATTSERPVCVFNGILSGLFIAHVWTAGIGVIALVVMGGVFSGWLSVVLGRLAWSQVGMPILSLPFAFVAMMTMAAGNSLSTLQYVPYIAPPELFEPAVDQFFQAFSKLYFIAHPYAGILLILVLLVFSRYYLLLAMVGYCAARLWMQLLGAAPEHLAATGWDSNAILAALLVGGLFATPSFITATLAVLAAVFAAWLSLALGRIFSFAELSAFSVPFVLAAWLVLYAGIRNNSIAHRFNMQHPDFPERSHERSAIARARVGSPGSVPLALPFMGVWTVSQGFSGEHTHRGLWRHALDFIVVKDGKSFTNRGNRLEDFYCFNLPVLSPAYGQVWYVVNEVPDNAPGKINVAFNWGNLVLIRLADGKFVLVAHLKQYSAQVYAGMWVKPGDLIGYCGNSGRSPQPHIHMHLQLNAELGSPTAPFHLSSIMVSLPGETPRYELAVVPPEGSLLTNTAEGHVRPFNLLAGRGLRYSTVRNAEQQIDWTLHCEVDELGRLVLVSSHGGRCFAESTWAVFSCYERDAVSDPLLDIWLLSCGFTPCSAQVEHWVDYCIPSKLIPHSMARLLSFFAWPWTSFARSHVDRHWDADAQGWRQKAQHRQFVSGITVQTDALITPMLGCNYISAKVGANRYIMQATSAFQKPDVGVPAWETPLKLSTTLA